MCGLKCGMIKPDLLSSTLDLDVSIHRVCVQVPQIRDLPPESTWQGLKSASDGSWWSNWEGAGGAAPAAGCPASPPALTPLSTLANCCCHRSYLQSCLPGRDLAQMRLLLPVIRALSRAALFLMWEFCESGKSSGLRLPFYGCAVGTGLSVMAMLTYNMEC